MRLEHAFHCRVQAGYGLTESGPFATTAKTKNSVKYKNEQDRVWHLSMAGWPMVGCEVRVVDAHMRDVPRDMESVGEVVMRGDNIMEGYYKEPKATADVMTDGWLHTGDMAVWDEETYVHIVDRKKDIIISGGENISSIGVEGVFAHPAVLECAVVGAPDTQWEKFRRPSWWCAPAAGEPRGLCQFLSRGSRALDSRQFEFGQTYRTGREKS